MRLAAHPQRRPSAAPPRHRAAGWAARAGTAALRRMPGALAYALADLASLGVVGFTVLRERRVARRGRGLFRNQRIAFRERLTPRLARRLLFGWARHVTRLAVDFCRMPRLHAGNLGRHVDAAELEPLLREAAQGRPLLAVSGHIGVWELCSFVPSLLGTPVSVVVRPLSIPPLDDVVNGIRRASGQEVLAKWGVVRPLLRALERGRVVGLLADENVRDKPIFAPFLGTLASTTRAPAFLHLATGAPLAVVTCHRVGRERFRIRVWRVIRHTPTHDREEDLRAVTFAMNEALSRAILAHPEQWMWASRRFLTRPPGERPGPDGLPPPAPTTAPRGGG